MMRIPVAPRCELLEGRHTPNQLILGFGLNELFSIPLSRPGPIHRFSTPPAVRHEPADLAKTIPNHNLPLVRDVVRPETTYAPSVELSAAFHRSGPDSGSRSLGYLDASNGLQNPLMEKGKTEIEFGDVNNDGYVDMISIGDHGNPGINSAQEGVMVWFGNRAGTWIPYQTGDLGYGGVALGDVNNDNVMDIGYGMHHHWSSTDFGDQLIEVSLGDGTGKNWTPWDDGLATSGEDYGMFETDFADIDNDGDLDVGSVSFGCCSGVHVYRNHGDGTWSQSFGVLGGNTRNNFFFGDFNGDGNTDVASGHQFQTAYLGDGQGNFQGADGNLPPLGNNGRNGLSLGDVNNDGRDDLAFVTSGGGLAVWSWVSNGVWQNISNGLPATGQNEVSQVADMNLDGNADVLGFADGQVSIYTGDGAGNWTLAHSFDTQGIYGYAAFRVGTDVDHNGYPDIGIVAAEGTSSSNSRNRPRVFVETSVPIEPAVYPQYPNGRETLVAGSTRFIKWSAAIPSNVRRSSVSIDVSVSGPNGPWQPVASNLKSNGQYQWNVPGDLPASANAFLRFTMRTSIGNTMAITPRAFTVT